MSKSSFYNKIVKYKSKAESKKSKGVNQVKNSLRDLKAYNRVYLDENAIDNIITVVIKK